MQFESEYRVYHFIGGVFWYMILKSMCLYESCQNRQSVFSTKTSFGGTYCCRFCLVDALVLLEQIILWMTT